MPQFVFKITISDLFYVMSVKSKVAFSEYMNFEFDKSNRYENVLYIMAEHWTIVQSLWKTANNFLRNKCSAFLSSPLAYYPPCRSSLEKFVDDLMHLGTL
jgi:hypothetical protein